jgi:transposase
MENSSLIFEMALGLSSPWYVKNISFEQSGEVRELHIHIDFEKGFKFKQEDSSESTAYDTVSRKWQHLNFFEHKCYIHARVPRVKDESGKVHVQQVPWARSGSGFTLLFEAFSMLLIESEMPVSKAAKLVKVYPQRIWNIFHFWISKMHSEDEIKDLTCLGLDETSSKRGHKYVTLAVDMDERRVLFATEGKGAETIEKTVDYLHSKQVEISDIKNVCIDMSPAFISGCQKHLTDAAITFDRFHVVKEVNKALDQVRRNQRRSSFELKGHKYTFLKNNLTFAKELERDELLDQFKDIGQAYKLKEMFNHFWNIKEPEEAMSFLAFWCDYAETTNLEPFLKTVKMIKSHWTGINNYTKSKINNGILEGINSKVQLAKKRARGYRNINNFINMIYFIAGKLKCSYPQYSI